MAKLPETASERMFREMREAERRVRPFDMRSGMVEKAIADAMRQPVDHRSASEKMIAELVDRELSGPFRRQSAVEKAQNEIMRSFQDATGVGSFGVTAEAYKQTEYLARIASGAGVASDASSAVAAGYSQTAPKSIATVSDLAPFIRKARKQMKMNQQAFADYAGVGRRFLSELENGKPSLEFDKVLACARAAGIDIIAEPRRSL